jgi:hypothetical protein
MDLEQQVVEPTNSGADAEESAMVITVEEGEGEARETSTGGVRSSPKRKTSGVGVAIAERIVLSLNLHKRACMWSSSCLPI